MNRPYLGLGLGLRTDYYDEIIETKPHVDWFEIITENYLVDGGKPLDYLDKIRADYPMAMHGVSLSIAGTHDIDFDYLDKMKVLMKRIEPAWVSDHLCWTRSSAHNVHDLLPVPYTEESLNHVVERIGIVQNYLGRQIVLENPSTYLSFTLDEMSEAEFMGEMAERADCLILLDLNNIFVSAHNHNYDAYEYLNTVNPERVWQHHLAGHTYDESGMIIIDTHDQPVRTEVWDLYAHAIKVLGDVSTMIERDDNMPPLSELVSEVQIARDIRAELKAKAS